MSARVTVVIPLFKGAAYVAEAVESLLAQRGIEFLLFCIDDLSDDDSAAVAARAGGKRLTLLHNERRLGLSGNWNRALEVAQTPYVVIAHQDDVYERDFLASLVALADAHPRAFMAHSRARYVDERGAPLALSASRYKDAFWPAGETYERGGAEEMRALLRGNYVIAPAVVLRRDAVQRIGGFSGELQFVTDWEYWIRGVLAGHTIAGTKQRLIRWRRHSSTATEAHARTFLRFEEEAALVEWAAGEARRIGVELSTAEQYAPLRNVLLDAFATRLAAGDREPAAGIVEFTARRLPPESRRGVVTLMRIAMRGGRAAGALLAAAERAYIAAAARRRG